MARVRRVDTPEVRVPCKRCHKLYPKSQLSSRGLCPSCQYEAVTENVRQLREKRGPYYERWKHGIMRAYMRLLREFKHGRGKKKEKKD